MTRHTGPDWGAGGGEFVAPAYDVSALEAMVSIGGPRVWYRTGHVIYADGFEMSLAPWQLVFLGTGAAIVRTGRKSFAGAYALEITPSTTGGGTVGQRLSKRFPFLMNTRVGLEIMLNIEDDLVNTVALPYIRINLFDGTTLYLGTIVIDGNNDKLQYQRSSDGTLVDLAIGLGQIGGASVTPFFHVIKLVIDLALRQYVSCSFNSLVIPMTGLPLREVANPTVKHLEAQFGLWTTDVTPQQKVLFDNLIVTVDEP